MSDDRKERLALSVEDLENHEHLDLCQGRLNLEQPFVAEAVSRKDSKGVPQIYKVYAVEFNCTLLVAATICDMIRSRDREYGHTPSRLYIMRDTAWSRLPMDTVFTVRQEEILLLSPEIFPTPRAEVVYNEPYRRQPRRFGE